MSPENQNDAYDPVKFQAAFVSLITFDRVKEIALKIREDSEKLKEFYFADKDKLSSFDIRIAKKIITQCECATFSEFYDKAKQQSELDKTGIFISPSFETNAHLHDKESLVDEPSLRTTVSEGTDTASAYCDEKPYDEIVESNPTDKEVVEEVTLKNGNEPLLTEPKKLQVAHQNMPVINENTEALDERGIEPPQQNYVKDDKGSGFDPNASVMQTMAELEEIEATKRLEKLFRKKYKAKKAIPPDVKPNDLILRSKRLTTQVYEPSKNSALTSKLLSSESSFTETLERILDLQVSNRRKFLYDLHQFQYERKPSDRLEVNSTILNRAFENDFSTPAQSELKNLVFSFFNVANLDELKLIAERLEDARSVAKKQLDIPNGVVETPRGSEYNGKIHADTLGLSRGMQNDS